MNKESNHIPMTIFRKLLRKRLPGSTLMETITASVIFMIIFVMAMDTLSRLMSVDGSDADYILMENELQKCRKQINRQELRPETRTYPYEWGEIRVDISSHKPPVFRVEITATGQKHRKASYRFLQANP